MVQVVIDSLITDGMIGLEGEIPPEIGIGIPLVTRIEIVVVNPLVTSIAGAGRILDRGLGAVILADEGIGVVEAGAVRGRLTAAEGEGAEADRGLAAAIVIDVVILTGTAALVTLLAVLLHHHLPRGNPLIPSKFQLSHFTRTSFSRTISSCNSFSKFLEITPIYSSQECQ